jgi:hypothetical protein
VQPVAGIIIELIHSAGYLIVSPPAGWGNAVGGQRCGIWRMKLHMGQAQFETLQHYCSTKSERAETLKKGLDTNLDTLRLDTIRSSGFK